MSTPSCVQLSMLSNRPLRVIRQRKMRPSSLAPSLCRAATRHKQDKVTIIASPEIYDLGAWLEQLIAEATGKKGTGLVPIDDETLGGPDVYGKDRVFAYLRLSDRASAVQEKAIKALAEAGHPVITIDLADKMAVAQASSIGSFANGCRGSVLGIDPFDQPDVEFSKVETKKLTNTFNETANYRMRQFSRKMALLPSMRMRPTPKLWRATMWGRSSRPSLVGSKQAIMSACLPISRVMKRRGPGFRTCG